MRYIFINRFFHPDQSATAIMLGDLIEGLGETIGPTLVITSSGTHTAGVDGSLAPLSGVEVIRLPTLAKRSRSTWARLVGFLTFYVGVVAAGLLHFRRGDIVVCLTDPPLALIAVQAVARLRGARLVNWVQDIYPETATLLGFGTRWMPVIRFATWLRDRAWKKSHCSICIGHQMRDFLLSRGVPAERLHVIPNWTNEQSLVPIENSANPLRGAWGYEPHHIVVGYSGNFGRAHDGETMLDAERRLVALNETALKFLFVGGGVKHALLPSVAHEPLIAPHFQVRNYTARSELNQSLCVADIHWLSLEPELEGLIVPSKIYSALAVGRPVVFIGNPEGEVARIIAKADCGRSFAKGNVQQVVDYIRLLARDSALRLRLGSNARRYSVERLSRRARLTEWGDLLLATAGDPARRQATLRQSRSQ